MSIAKDIKICSDEDIDEYEMTLAAANYLRWRKNRRTGFRPKLFNKYKFKVREYESTISITVYRANSDNE